MNYGFVPSDVEPFLVFGDVGRGDVEVQVEGVGLLGGEVT